MKIRLMGLQGCLFLSLFALPQVLRADDPAAGFSDPEAITTDINYGAEKPHLEITENLSAENVTEQVQRVQTADPKAQFLLVGDSPAEITPEFSDMREMLERTVETPSRFQTHFSGVKKEVLQRTEPFRSWISEKSESDRIFDHYRRAWVYTKIISYTGLSIYLVYQRTSFFNVWVPLVTFGFVYGFAKI